MALFRLLMDEEGGGLKGQFLPKICYIYLTMIKLSTVTLHLKKIQKMYESREKPFESADISIFYQKLTIFIISGNTDKNYILINFS